MPRKSAQSNNNQGVINRDANAAYRASEAANLRAQKLTFDEIAKRCGYASPGAARNAIQRELKRTVVENVNELRQEESAMLDRLQVMCWGLADDENNEKRLFAIDRILKISEQRSRLLGLEQSAASAQASAQVVVRAMPPGYLGEVVESTPPPASAAAKEPTA